MALQKYALVASKARCSSTLAKLLAKMNRGRDIVEVLSTLTQTPQNHKLYSKHKFTISLIIINIPYITS